MIYYISSGFFTEETREKINSIAKILRSVPGNEVIVPMEFLVPNGENLPHEQWAKEVFDYDVAEINRCDKVIYLDFGADGDCGAAWEVGYAFAKGIPVETYKFGKDISLMIYNSSSTIKFIDSSPLKLV